MYERSGIFDREGFSRGGCDVRLAPRGSFLVITDRGGAAAVRRRVTVRRVRGRAGREEDEVLGMQPATRRGYLHPWQHDHDVALPPRLFLVQATHRHNPHRRCGASHRRSPEPSPPFPAWTRLAVSWAQCCRCAAWRHVTFPRNLARTGSTAMCGTPRAAWSPTVSTLAPASVRLRP